jgi:VanZ family protein
MLLVIYTYFGLTPHPEQTIGTDFNDKLMHFGGYVIAALSMSVAIPKSAIWQRGIFLIMYSIAIEIGQHFMPPRTFDVLDIVANASGVIVGLILVNNFLRKWILKL